MDSKLITKTGSVRPFARRTSENLCWVFTACGLMLLGGFAVGPNYHQPAANTLNIFRFAPGQSTNSFGDLPRWDVFQDPILQDLIRGALTSNCDLKQAVPRVEQARSLAVGARSPCLPQIGCGGDSGRGRNGAFTSKGVLDGATLRIQQGDTNPFAGNCRISNDRRINVVASKLETDRAAAALANAVSLNVASLRAMAFCCQCFRPGILSTHHMLTSVVSS